MALDKLLQWANIAYIVCVAIAAAATFAIYHLSARVNTAKDRELEKFRTESTIKITAAQAEAAKAMKIAESERLARAELESQIAAAEARAAQANAVASQAQLELAKLKEPRTIAPEQQERLIAALKKFAGQNFGFSVFPEPEPLALLRALDAVLKSAGWIRVPSQIGHIVVDAAGETAGTSHDSGVAAFVGPATAKVPAWRCRVELKPMMKSARQFERGTRQHRAAWSSWHLVCIAGIQIHYWTQPRGQCQRQEPV